MRTTNARKLRELIKAKGERGKENTAVGAMVSSSTLEKMMCESYGRCPRQALRDRLSKYLGVSEDDLFPPVGASGKRTG